MNAEDRAAARARRDGPPSAADWLLDPYLVPEPDAPYKLQWAVMDNADADSVREALQEAILRLRAIGPALESVEQERDALKADVERLTKERDDAREQYAIFGESGL